MPPAANVPRLAATAHEKRQRVPSCGKRAPSDTNQRRLVPPAANVLRLAATAHKNGGYRDVAIITHI